LSDIAPDRFIDNVFAYQKTAAVKAAIELDLFSAIGDDRVSPPFPAAFAFVMLATTPKGDAWTARELQEMGRSAGFADNVVRPLPPSPQTMIVFR
jgi:hypothetical protein